MLIKVLIVSFLLIAGCQDNFQRDYERAKSLSEKQQNREASVILYDIVNSDKSQQELKYKSYFLLADIYLKMNQYENSINIYKKLLEAPIENKLRKQSLFMIGYIYFNNLEMYSESILYYNQFLNEYQNDDLIASVNFELETIQEILNKGKKWGNNG